MFTAFLRGLTRLRDDPHAAVALNVGKRHARTTVVSTQTRGDPMSKRKQERDELTEDEVERQEGEPLPERTQMSVLYPSPVASPPIIGLPIEPPEDTPT